MDQAPEVFQPCSGAWGRQGCTNVHLASAKANLVRPALQLAAENVIAGTRKKKSGEQTRRGSMES